MWNVLFSKLKQMKICWYQHRVSYFSQHSTMVLGEIFLTVIPRGRKGLGRRYFLRAALNSQYWGFHFKRFHYKEIASYIFYILHILHILLILYGIDFYHPFLSKKVKYFCHSIDFFFFGFHVIRWLKKKMTILVVSLMDFFIELYLMTCVGTVLMSLVMTDKFALQMWWKQFLLLSFCFCSVPKASGLLWSRVSLPALLGSRAFGSLETFVETFLWKLCAASAQSWPNTKASSPNATYSDYLNWNNLHFSH